MSEAEWNREQAARLYQMSGWGRDFFAINELGNIQVVTDGTHPIDLKSVCDRMALQGLNPPLLLRFSDVIRRRMEQIHQRFLIARQESSYRGRYFGVYPIKVNQQHRVIKEIVDFGRRFQWGLEVGSKPELHAVLAMLDHVEGPIICNGYKDRAFTELALIGQKMGHQVFLVVEKPNELSLILDVAHYLKVTPLIGLRCRLAAMGNGHWENSGGDRSKFGLSASEMLEAIDQLRQRGSLKAFGCSTSISAAKFRRSAVFGKPCWRPPGILLKSGGWGHRFPSSTWVGDSGFATMAVSRAARSPSTTHFRNMPMTSFGP